MKSNRGFSLVELLIALCIFAIVATSLTALLTSGLKARQKSQRILNAQQIAYAIIEDHKNFWTIKNNYAVKVPAPTPAQQLLPRWDLAGYLQNVGVEVARVSVAYGCLDTDGTNRSVAATLAITTEMTQAQVLNCSVNDPDLRRVTITIQDAQGQVTANLTSEIGKPVAAR
jgi:prepilin-type N-terminal cleavage/methylation domain-containing protein